MVNESTATFHEAISVARFAPSLHNSQPWHWRTHQNQLTLGLDQTRLLPATDPDLHGAILSCGAALALAELALRANGHAFDIARPADPATGTLAVVTRHGTAPPDHDAAKLISAAADRRSDRRPLDGSPALGDFVDSLRSELAPGIALHLIHDGDQLVSLALATQSAEQRELQDPAYRAELASWIPDDHESGRGIPAEDRPYDPRRRTTVNQREFAPHGAQEPWYNASLADETIDRPAFVIVLTDGDAPIDWLLAGEETMRVMLHAQQHSLASCAVSQPVDRGTDRARVRRLLGMITYPQMVLRLGAPIGNSPAPTPTPRRSMAEILTRE